MPLTKDRSPEEKAKAVEGRLHELWELHKKWATEDGENDSAVNIVAVFVGSLAAIIPTVEGRREALSTFFEIVRVAVEKPVFKIENPPSQEE